MTLGDRLVVMNNGIIEQVGSLFEVYTSPLTLFVAKFIGVFQMNFFCGKLENGKFYTSDFEVNVTCSLKNKKATMGVRPEHFKIQPNGQIKIKIELVEELGADSLIYGVTGSGTDISVKAEGNSGYEVGKYLSISFLIEKLHFFDLETNQRLT